MTVPPPDVTFRPANERDLSACADLWRDGINDYQVRLNQPPIPDDPASTGRLGRLHAHTLATDPDRFVVATRANGPGRDRIAAFGSAVVRGDVWFLSMLFVDPTEQARGLGRALLARILPPPDDGLVLATATDSVQPISNALYASIGIVPRQPIWNMAGGPEAGEARSAGLAPLPGGVRAVAFTDIEGRGPGQQGVRMLVDAIDELDRGSVGFSHQLDHAFLRGTEAAGYLYLGPDGSPVGYGYASPVGRVGPIAARDDELMEPILGHLLRTVEARGAQMCWVPADADRVLTGLLRVGFRIEGFPVLLCWTRPFADFSRYLPMSPGLL